MKKGTGGIDYTHFLQAYNPTQAYHELDGSALQRKTTDLANSTLPKNGSMKALGAISKSTIKPVLYNSFLISVFTSLYNMI